MEKKSQTMVDTLKALRKVKKKWKKWVERSLWNGMHGELHVKMPSWKLKTHFGGLMRKKYVLQQFSFSFVGFNTNCVLDKDVDETILISFLQHLDVSNPKNLRDQLLYTNLFGLYKIIHYTNGIQRKKRQISGHTV